MKRRLDPKQLQAHAQRGTRRVPEALARYRGSMHRRGGDDDPFPHGRYCLGFDLADAGSWELRVRDLYRGLLPWLAHDLVARPQAWIDLIALVDELMQREDDWFAWAAPWPLSELRLVIDEAAGLLADQPSPFAGGRLSDLDDDLARRFAGLQRDLAANTSRCTDVLVNVHWW